MKVSVVVPVNNEADNIAPLTRKICAALEGSHDYEIILVDDGSTDETRTILSKLQRELPRLRTIRHHECYGQSTALLTGVKKAKNPIIATLDGDGQNDPNDIEKLLEIYNKAATKSDRIIVTGFRRHRCDTAWRRFSSRLANTLRSRLLGDETPDTGCGLKVFSRDLFLSLPYFDHMHRFLPALVKRAGGVVKSVEVNHYQREHGNSHYGTLDRLTAGIADLIGVMWLMKRSKIPKIEEVDLSNEQ